jgi:hypothetical protein
MRTKGAIEVFANTILMIVCVIAFIITIYFIFEYFTSFNYTVKLHETDRKMNDFTENLLTNCSLLYYESIFDARALNDVESMETLTERCFRYCNLGMHLTITDLTTNEKWDMGYDGQINENSKTKTFKAGIYNENSVKVTGSQSTETTTTTIQQCSDIQESCEQYSIKEECTAACCGWDYECSSCSDLSFNRCNDINYMQGVCSFDNDENVCKYTGIPVKREDINTNIHPGTVEITLYEDFNTLIGCEAEKVFKTGNPKTIFVSKSNLPEEATTKKITITGDANMLCITLPVYKYATQSDNPSDVDVKFPIRWQEQTFCRKLYGIKVSSLEFELDRDLNLTLTKNGEEVVFGIQRESHD